MHFGLIMHRITTPIILGVMFFLVITPTGFLMRIFSHNSMPLNADKENTTYRIISRARKKEDMEKPF
jgi:ABC-type sugar transport system permease subunit